MNTPTKSTPKRLSAAALCAVLLLALPACGQRGPLYLPDKVPDTAENGQAAPQPDREKEDEGEAPEGP